MKAAELIKEEPFAEQLIATLSDFLALRFGGSWKVSWKNKHLSVEEQLWLVNLNINAIFRKDVSRRALENIQREFATSVIPWKRPLQRIYFWLATKATPRLAAHAVVEVEPPIPGADQCIIIPSSHKIRFIDARAGISFCFLKNGSSQTHFQFELDAREFAEHHGLPVPRILERLSESCIAEQMITGTPLNRLTSKKQRMAGLQCALDAMEPIYQATLRKTNLADYAAVLVSRIEAIAALRRGIASTGALHLARQLAEALPSGQTVELVRSHGDFHPGNILYDRGKIWLIDWEYSGQRQQHYDLLTYRTEIRFARNLAKRLVNYLRLPAGHFPALAHSAICDRVHSLRLRDRNDRQFAKQLLRSKCQSF